MMPLYVLYCYLAANGYRGVLEEKKPVGGALQGKERFSLATIDEDHDGMTQRDRLALHYYGMGTGSRYKAGDGSNIPHDDDHGYGCQNGVFSLLI